MDMLRTFPMKTYVTVALLALALPLAPAFAQDTASAKLIDKTGKDIGTAKLRQGPKGVLIHVKVSGLTPGKHGLHLHSHGECDPKTGFKSAKGHVGKVAGAHGLMNPKGPEPGDLPNIFVGADGTGEMETYTTLVSIGKGDHNLLDTDGSTLVIHEKPDDHITQPIGGAGPRVACGIIKND
jgi:Cu-Zn family superoxide dismutase